MTSKLSGEDTHTEAAIRLLDRIHAQANLINHQAAVIDDLQLEISAMRVALSTVNQKASRALNALIAMGKVKP